MITVIIYIHKSTSMIELNIVIIMKAISIMKEFAEYCDVVPEEYDDDYDNGDENNSDILMMITIMKVEMIILLIKYTSTAYEFTLSK